jgi:heme A synthase
LNLYTDYFGNSYSYTYTIVNVPSTNYSAIYLVNDIKNFNRAGFNDFARFLISIVFILAIVVGVTSKTQYGNSSDETLLLVFMLVLVFSYIGWMRVPFENMPNEAVRQYFIAMITGLLTLANGLRRMGVFQ